MSLKVCLLHSFFYWKTCSFESLCACVQNLCVISNVHRLSQQLKMVLDCCNVPVKLIRETCAGLYEYKQKWQRAHSSIYSCTVDANVWKLCSLLHGKCCWHCTCNYIKTHCKCSNKTDKHKSVFAVKLLLYWLWWCLVVVGLYTCTGERRKEGTWFFRPSQPGRLYPGKERERDHFHIVHTISQNFDVNIVKQFSVSCVLQSSWGNPPAPFTNLKPISYLYKKSSISW